MSKYCYQQLPRINSASNKTFKFTCVGYRNKYSTRTEATSDCIECPFSHYGKGLHWSDDYIKCTCSKKVMPGDKISARVTRSIEIKKS